MLPTAQKVLFAIFALVTSATGARGFYRLYRRVAVGRGDTDQRLDHLPRRVFYALITTLTQRRTFRKRPVISFFHSLIFYGFAFYLLVNLIDGIEGFFPFALRSVSAAGAAYNLLADLLSAGVLSGVVALIIRRFALPSRRDFRFNERTLLHRDVKQRYVTRDSIIVSTFILFHVGSRALAAGAKLAQEGPDRFQPFATLISHVFSPQNAATWRVSGYWGALGSVLVFLAYFPYSKHIHIFMAPAKYLVARTMTSGVLPAVAFGAELESQDREEPAVLLGANKLEDLAWPRLLDAYACIQCNRCQDVCPATATGKSLSPSALEINKRMELNDITRTLPAFESGAPSPHPLLSFALTAEAAWACTTCGACMQVCPVQDEPMLDIIDIRRQQVMMEGEFPAQLQTAFRGMERTQNPWGIARDKRLDWADGLNVPTTDQKPEPDVLFWVGCAAAYDPQSQKTARAFVQLLDHAGVDFAVLGKRECCTGDSARRAGNEYLYKQLAEENIATLNEIRPKLIVATCPHCMNAVGKEYSQLGGDYKVMHHTEYLETLVSSGRLVADSGSATITFHDPCYLGRHNDVYDAPRNVLNVLSNQVVELPRNRENSFCCGAGGAQFWKEEEPGEERISDNRYREVKETLKAADEKVLAVGCPFCKSMLDATPNKGGDSIEIKDVAVLLLEGVERRAGKLPQHASPALSTLAGVELVDTVQVEVPATMPMSAPALPTATTPTHANAPEALTAARKKWPGKSKGSALTQTAPTENAPQGNPSPAAQIQELPPTTPPEAEKRKKWQPKIDLQASSTGASTDEANAPHLAATTGDCDSDSKPRKVWNPKKK
ncbi:MAG TPA: heterodisulfide reductase-related iron-sulfur binding cluster [Acidobacteriaceae bacterium]|nr:heterodisulfide reductase-related iron-sulfur binding cluster [Acidobacteriaceae bacterium]